MYKNITYQYTYIQCLIWWGLVRNNYINYQKDKSLLLMMVVKITLRIAIGQMSFGLYGLKEPLPSSVS